MSKFTDIQSDVQTTINTNWDKRNGNKVPSTDEVKLAGGAVEISATFLYADLANSSRMAKTFDRRLTAKILKSFLAAVSKLILHNDGKIVSFDGDRVMGVFYGDSKNTNAAKCALNINSIVTEVIRPKFENHYDTVKNADFKIAHGVGVDTGTVFSVRGGVRGNNDLIWIGRAPNLAAKLSDVRESKYHSFITATVYNNMNDSKKFHNGESMWESRTFSYCNENVSVYRSSWRSKP